MKEPRVTVLMPVYNGEAFLHGAISSILSQSFRDFELLVINDGSKDKSVQIIESFRDPRIRVMHNEANKGLIYSLNKGFDLARGEYIARMDCDDTCLSIRLEKQVDFMQAHPEVGISGTWIEVRGKKIYPMKYPADYESIRCNMLFYCALAHPSVIIRKEVIKRYQLYFDESYVRAEDYELWVRALDQVKIANLPEILVRYRLRPDLLRTKLGKDQLSTASRVRRNQLARMGFDDRDEDFWVHEAVATCRMQGGKSHFGKAEKWLLKLREKNRQKGKYLEEKLEEAIGDAWFRLCEGASRRGLWTLKTYFFSPLREWGKIETLRRLKFVAKCLLGYSVEA